MATAVENTLSADGLEIQDLYVAVAEDLEQLAMLHDAAPSRGLLDALQESQFPYSLGLRLVSERSESAQVAIAQALAQMPRPIDDATLDALAVDYANIYLSHVLRASPYESVWFDEEHLERQLPMFQVREYYNRHHVAPADWRKRSEDHIVLQLQFIAHLLTNVTNETEEDVIREAACFMDDHLLRWLPCFAERVDQRCNMRYFAGIGVLTCAYCDELRDVLADVLGEPRPSAEDIEKRMSCTKSQGAIQPIQYVPGMGPTV
jgi:TorA maturation chaperone TorD